MPKPIRPENEPINADSFLDIVASVVCIMLIMVLMIGMRIKNTPVEAPLSPEAAQAAAELEKNLSVEQSLRGDVLKVAGEIRNVAGEAAVRGTQRDMLATTAAALEYTIRERRGQMDTQAQREFDLSRGLAESQRQLEELHRTRTQVDSARAAPVVVHSYPTPISRAVDDHEAHFQLRAGRIAFIPLEPLIQKLKSDAQRQLYKLRDAPEFTDTVGPEGGFRLRYTMERKETAPDLSTRGGTWAELKHWTLVPLSQDLGEPADVALAEDSDFRRALRQFRPGRHTVTIWLYGDSFAAFRQVRQELYRLGYAVAARPLPADTPIGGSPEGSKSAAQ